MSLFFLCNPKFCMQDIFESSHCQRFYESFLSKFGYQMKKLEFLSIFVSRTCFFLLFEFFEKLLYLCSFEFLLYLLWCLNPSYWGLFLSILGQCICNNIFFQTKTGFTIPSTPRNFVKPKQFYHHLLPCNGQQ